MSTRTEAPARAPRPAAGRRAFAPPDPRGHLVPRRRLVRSLARDDAHTVVAVSAQAGYGKSTLLAQWADADRRPFAWITVGPHHDDAAVLVEEVVAAVDEVAGLDPGLVRMATSGEPALSTRLLPRLGRGLRALTEPFVLVLDDAHLLASARAHEVLWVVATSLPPGAQLALGTRAAPPLREQVLRTRRTLRVVDAQDLAMGEADAARLVSGAGVTATDAQLRELVRATEGWPAGLYLGALALRERWPDGVRPFAGDHHLVVGYVREELLATRTAEEVDFLLGTSVLDGLTGPLCDELLQRSGSDAMLRALARDNLFVIPLDARHERFRYHQLFADALRAELQAREPARAHGLHMRASAIAASAGDLDRAVRHALAADEHGVAAGIVWRALPGLFTRGRRATAERWADAFPPGVEQRDAHLALVRAWIALHTDSDRVAHWATLAGQIGHEGPLADGTTLPAALAVIRAMVGHGGLGQMRRDAAFAYEACPEPPVWRAVACLLEGAALHGLGHPADARARLEEGAVRAGGLMPSIEMQCVAWLAFQAVLADDRDLTRELTARSQAVMRDAGLEEYGTAAISRALAALSAAWSGRLDDAREGLMNARRLLAVTRGVAPLVAVGVRLVLVRAALAIGEPAVAAVMLREVGPFMPYVADGPVIVREVEDARRTVEAMPTDAGVVGGAGALTSAEIRILRYLPTHLSFREIGDRLHVSRFTVKSQAMSVYRKLGVSSRSEAVELAVSMGLIER